MLIEKRKKVSQRGWANVIWFPLKGECEKKFQLILAAMTVVIIIQQFFFNIKYTLKFIFLMQKNVINMYFFIH